MSVQTDPAEQPRSAAPGLPWDRVYSFAGNIVAPATAVSALLFYFGYVSTRAQYLYFGLDVDTIGLSTQSFVMRSPGPLPLIQAQTSSGSTRGGATPVTSAATWQRWRAVAECSHMKVFIAGASTTGLPRSQAR